MSSKPTGVGAPLADRIVRYFMRRRPGATPAQAAAYARVSLFTLINGIATLAYAFGFFGLGRVEAGAIMLTSALVSFAGTAMARRTFTESRLDAIIHVVLVASAVGMAVVACLAGQLGEITPWFLCLCTAAAILLLGERAGMLWTLAIVATILAIPALRASAPPSAAYTPASWEIPVSQAALALILGFYAVATRRATDVHVDTLDAHDVETRRYVERLERSQSELEAALANADTERDRAEHARREAEAAKLVAEEANLAKSRFLANMSHELRTPLTAIIGYSEMIEEEVGAGSEAARDAARVQRAGTHLLGVINDILDLTRVEAGRAELYVDAVDVRALVADLEEELRPTAALNQNTLFAEVADAVPTLRTDRMRLRQILSNLLSNASKFTTSGTVSLRVDLDGGEVRFRVEDTGVGIDPDKLALVFEPFRQADSSSTRRYGGTGLGLAIASSYTALLGGTIEVVSQPGEGSRFEVRLPTNGPSSRQGAPFALA